jgi:hypothetical protein
VASSTLDMGIDNVWFVHVESRPHEEVNWSAKNHPVARNLLGKLAHHYHMAVAAESDS